MLILCSNLFRFLTMRPRVLVAWLLLGIILGLVQLLLMLRNSPIEFIMHHIPQGRIRRVELTGSSCSFRTFFKHQFQIFNACLEGNSNKNGAAVVINCVQFNRSRRRGLTGLGWGSQYPGGQTEGRWRLSSFVGTKNSELSKGILR